MANISIDKFCDQIALQVRGCPLPVMRDAVRNAIRELCERSGIWTETDTDSVPADGMLDFSFAFGSAEVIEVEQLYIGGREIERIDAQGLDDRFPGWRMGVAYEGEPQFYASLDDDTLKLVPWQASEVTYRLRLKPSVMAVDVPDFLYRKHREAVCAGALAELLIQRGQDWYEPNLALKHATDFDGTISKAQELKAKGRQGGVIRSKASFF